jgi:hypothetical protein
MMARIRKTWHVVVHKAPLSPLYGTVVRALMMTVATAIMIALFLVVGTAERTTHVDGRKWFVTVIADQPVDNWALKVRGQWTVVDKLTYVRCPVGAEFPRCARWGDQ